MCLLDMKCKDYCHLEELQTSGRSIHIIVPITLFIISRMSDSLRVLPAYDRDKVCFEAGNDAL